MYVSEWSKGRRRHEKRLLNVHSNWRYLSRSSIHSISSQVLSPSNYLCKYRQKQLRVLTGIDRCLHEKNTKTNSSRGTLYFCLSFPPPPPPKKGTLVERRALYRSRAPFFPCLKNPTNFPTKKEELWYCSRFFPAVIRRASPSRNSTCLANGGQRGDEGMDALLRLVGS